MEGPQIREISPLRAMFSARLAYPMDTLDAQNLYTLDQALSLAFAETSTSLLMLGEYAVCVFQDGHGKYGCFNSHSCNVIGLPDPQGKSVVVFFNTRDELHSHLLRLAGSLSQHALLFELQPVKITRSSPSPSGVINYHQSETPLHDDTVHLSAAASKDKASQADLNKKKLETEKEDYIFKNAGGKERLNLLRRRINAKDKGKMLSLSLQQKTMSSSSETLKTHNQVPALMH